MGTWTLLDTLLAAVALLAVATAVYFARQSGTGTESRPSVSLSASPTVGQTEATLRAAELADQIADYPRTPGHCDPLLGATSRSIRECGV
jgi:hypothetical protein